MPVVHFVIDQFIETPACIVASGVADYEHFLMHVLLDHPSVGGASSHFALSLTKYTTAVPV